MHRIKVDSNDINCANASDIFLCASRKQFIFAQKIKKTFMYDLGHEYKIIQNQFLIKNIFNKDENNNHYWTFSEFMIILNNEKINQYLDILNESTDSYLDLISTDGNEFKDRLGNNISVGSKLIVYGRPSDLVRPGEIDVGFFIGTVTTIHEDHSFGLTLILDYEYGFSNILPGNTLIISENLIDKILLYKLAM